MSSSRSRSPRPIRHCQSYYLRARSDKESSTSTTSTSSTVSPTSPLTSTSPTPIPSMHDEFKEFTSITSSNPTRMTRKRRRNPNSRKRKFSQIIESESDHESENESESDDNDNQDIDINIESSLNNRPRRKKAKYSRTIKFTLNDEKVISREASLKPSSPLLTKKRRHYPRIEEFEIPITTRSTRRNPYICCYEFFSGYKIGITMTLGARNDVKAAIKILSQELVSTRAKASIHTHKNTFLLYIKTRKDKMIGCAIVHVDNVLKRVNIEMFAVDESWRGNGFASMMVHLIQYRMINWSGYELFVCAADSAVPFWSNKKYNFVLAHKSLLEQHEVEDEKTGGTKHMIWYGTTIQARCALLNCFVQTSHS